MFPLLKKSRCETDSAIACDIVRTLPLELVPAFVGSAASEGGELAVFAVGGTE